MDTFLSQPIEYNHSPIPERVWAIQLTNQVKIRTQTSDEPTGTILHSALRTLTLSAASELPCTEMTMQTIRRQRATPSAVNKEEHLPEALRNCDRGEDSVLHEDTEIIIFTTNNNLSALKQSKHWFADGSFKVCD